MRRQHKITREKPKINTSHSNWKFYRISEIEYNGLTRQSHEKHVIKYQSVECLDGHCFSEWEICGTKLTFVPNVFQLNRVHIDIHCLESVFQLRFFFFIHLDLSHLSQMRPIRKKNRCMYDGYAYRTNVKCKTNKN